MLRTLFVNKLYIFVSFSLVVVFQSPVYACNYYVDATNGNDIYNGMSALEPWQTLERVNDFINNNTANSIQPGDKVCLKRGEVWREELLISRSGTALAPIIFSAYGTAEVNPLIIRSDPVGWWQSSIAIGGFEWFEKDQVDIDNPNFYWPWYESSNAGTRIVAETEDVVQGFYAAKIERIDTSSAPAFLSMKRFLQKNTQHYFRFYVQTEGDAALHIRVRDDRPAPDVDLYLQPDGSWTPAATFLKSYRNVPNYTADAFTFTTASDPGHFQVQFKVDEGEGSVWIDEVVILEGNSEPDYKLWQARIPGKVFGLQHGDQRIPTRNYNDVRRPDPLTLLDGEALHVVDRFYYRRDDSNLNNIEVGKRMNAIRIMQQSHIIVENIDVYGAGVRAYNASKDDSQALIFIQPGSSHITIRDLTASYASGNSISAGILYHPNNPTNILYENLKAYNGESTAFYLRGQGTIRNNTAFNIGREHNDGGDQGGIGVQGGPALIEDNKIFMIGRDIDRGDVKLDAAISICCPLKGKIEIRNNQVYDVYGPALQLAGEGIDHGHIITGNTVRRYGKTSKTDSVTGKYAGIKLSNIPGALVEHNVISDASANINATGISLYGNVQNLIIRKNVFHNNQGPEIHGVYKSNETLDATGLSSNDNIYRRSDYTNAWRWLGTSYSSLQEWQDARGLDSRSILLSP